MGAIKVSVTIAGQVSSQLRQAASALTAIQAPTALADRTTVAGNAQAKSSGASLVSALQGISNALAKDGNNVHSVAKEFSAIDQQAKAQFDAISILSSPLGRTSK